jgi:hypothetical protein
MLICAALVAADAAAVAGDAGDAADLAALMRRSLEIVEQQNGPVNVLVVPSDADPGLKIALATLRPTITPDEVPPSGRYTLPQGYLVVRSLQSYPYGSFNGVLGPGALAGTQGTIADHDCGLQYRIVFRLKDGRWENGPYRTRRCEID